MNRQPLTLPKPSPATAFCVAAGACLRTWRLQGQPALGNYPGRRNHPSTILLKILLLTPPISLPRLHLDQT